MAKEKINLAEVADLTKELFHEYYAGNPAQWFSYLCPDSIYLGTGEPLLFGGNAIKAHFKILTGKETNVVQEEYFPITLSDQVAQVCGRIIVENKEKLFRVMIHFTIDWRLTLEGFKIVHQHNSYEYIPPEETSALRPDVNTTQFIRSLLLEHPGGRRISVRSGTQTVFVNPLTILYVQSQRNRTELVCTDRTISCNSPLHEMAKMLPEVFYPLRRGYLVNILYVVAIRRFEAEMISGFTIPIPALKYQQVKQDLQKLIKE